MTHDTPAPGEGALSDELANVHMLTDRGDFEQARELCQGLLRDNPDSADAHAAMGDVYAGEGGWSDAVQWYELALELDFDPSVMERLAAARGQSIRSGTGPIAGPSVAIPRRPAPEEEQGGKQQVIGLVVVGVLLISALVFFLIRTGGRSEREEDGQASGRAVAAPIEPYVGAHGPQTPTIPTAGGGAPPGTSPVMPASAPPAVSYTGQPPTAPRNAPRAPSSRWTTPSPTALYNRTEQRVQARMHLERWRDGTSISSGAALALDDFSGFGIITIRAPLTDDLNRLERDVLTAAYRAATSAMRADKALQDLVVRCVARAPAEDGGEENVVIFRARVTRDSLRHWLGVSRMPTLEQIKSGLLNRVWWDKEALARYLKTRNQRKREADEDKG